MTRRAAVAETARSSSLLAALPLAAAATLLAARALPVHFAYRENTLGIVSAATEARYPLQQETFWLAFALGAGTLAALALERWLRRESLGPARALALEASAAACLASVLLLPTPVGVSAALACAAAARAAAGPRGARSEGGARPEAGEVAVAPAQRAASGAPGSDVEAAGASRLQRVSRSRALLWAAALLAVAVLLTPSVLGNAWNVAHRVPDEARTVNAFTFHGEMGQHLAWADALRRGGFHGRDFFCLYGPLYDLGAVGIWALVGRSIAAWELYFSATRILGLAALLWLAALLARRPAWALALPLLVPWVNLRIGLALLGLLALFAWLRRPRLGLAAAAGALCGVSLLYSQEFGLALALASALAFVLRGSARAALAFGAAGALTAGPVLAWYAANDALTPMLADLVAYPGSVLAGFGKLPFPSLASGLPLDLGALGTQRSLLLRLGYAAPAVAWAACLLALPLASLERGGPLASARAAWAALRGDPRRACLLVCGVFSLLCFRSAMGRSDLVHVVNALAPAALLVVLGADALHEAARAHRLPRALVAWRAAALAGFVALAGFAEAPRPLRELSRFASDAAALWRYGNHPQGSPEVMRVVRWLQLNSEPDDRVLFLPNDAAYYYLLDRPSPIRFVMGHQIATDADRAEVLAALRTRPPRYVVWDHGALRVDGIEDERVFGRELLGWIEAHYAEAARLGEVVVLAPRPSGPAREPAAQAR
jgi:hypothetical protein